MPVRSPQILAIIGQGYVGLPLAMAAVDAGWTVIGVDNLESKVFQINSGLSPVEDISNAMEKNDYSNQGHSHIIEEPSISITYKHKDFYISAQIDKDYVYRTENSDSDFPGYEEIKLNNVEITNNSVTLYNENGNEFVFTLAELGNETFKHLEKTLKKYLK